MTPPAPLFVTLRCLSVECRLRFPAEAAAAPTRCPRCGGVLASAEVWQPPDALPTALRRPAQRPTVALLDSLRSAYNVGSIFRSADGAGLRHIYLCGLTATPPHPRIAKTALGAEQAIPWSYHPDAVETAEQLQAHGLRLWGLEATADAVDLFALPGSAEPVVLLVGNERSGLDPALLRLCDLVVAIPMRGVKESLNVATAFGIAAYTAAG